MKGREKQRRGLLLLLLLLGSLAGCGVRKLEDAYAAAQALAADWNAAELNLYCYQGLALDGEEKSYLLVMTPAPGAFASREEAERHQSRETAALCVAAVEGELAACFAGFPVQTVIVVCDSGGRALYTFVDGEIVT